MDLDWDRVIQHARAHPEDAAYSDGHYYESVLYLACQHNPPAAAIRAILQACPEAARQVSRAHHDLAMHIAARCQLSAEILEELLRDFPVTAVEQTRFGRTPLMALWEFRRKSIQPGQHGDEGHNETNLQETNDENVEDQEFWNKVIVILKAIARFREDPKYFSQMPSTRTKAFRSHICANIDSCRYQARALNDDSGPDGNPFVLHAAVSLGALSCPVEVLEYVLARFPDQVKKRDRWGYLPLHLAIQPAPWNASTRRKYRARERRFVAPLLQAYPEAARIRLGDSIDSSQNADGYDFPLMAALNNQHTWNGIVQELFHGAPEILQVRDPATGLFPFQLAAIASSDTTDDYDLDTVFELLRAHPQVMELMDIAGETSVHAKERGKAHSEESVQMCHSTSVSTASIAGAVELLLLGTAAAVLIGISAGNLG